MINPKLAMWSQLERAGIPLNPTDNPHFSVVQNRSKPQERCDTKPVRTRYCVECRRRRNLVWFEGYRNTCVECKGVAHGHNV